MKTSARNAFTGTVTRVAKGAVNAEVELILAGGERLVAVITNVSVDRLGLKVGSKATALVKSSWVILGKHLENAKLSTRNILPGIVDRVQEGAVNSEVVLKLMSVRSLELKTGDKAFAAFKASHVILAVE